MSEIPLAGAESAHGSSAGVTGDRSQRIADCADLRPSPAGVCDEVSSTLAAIRAQLSGILDLAAIEARLAGLTLVSMVGVGLVGSICLVGAWVSVLFAFALWAVSLGFRPISIAIAIALSNLLAGAILGFVCIRISRGLLFSATRRQVMGKPRVEAAKP